MPTSYVGRRVDVALPTALPRLPPSFRPVALRDQRVLVLGLGTFGGGLGAALHLAREGADVTVSDLRQADELSMPLAELRELPIRYVLGRHPTVEAGAFDWIVASPAVKWSAPPLVEAARLGIPVESEITLLIRLLPCRWLGISGTNGKSTTTMLAGQTLAAAGRRVLIGGNIGGSLLDDWRAIGADDAVVLEISSFQLEHLGEIGLGPDVALITNVTHDHLDRHGTFEAYVAAKRQLLGCAQVAVLNRADAICQAFARSFAGRVIWYGEEAAFAAGEVGAKLIDRRFARFDRGPDAGHDDAPIDLEPLRLRGIHNRVNLLAAAAAATCFEVPFANAAAAAFEVAPLKRRLNEVARVGGVLYVDDSVATSPPAVAAALRTYRGATCLVAGGYDKGIDAGPLLDAIRASCRKVFLFGAVGPSLAERMAHVTASDVVGPDVAVFADLREAFAAAAREARSGETVLFSPGYASYDQFRNFTERGDLFCALVADLARA